MPAGIVPTLLRTRRQLPGAALIPVGAPGGTFTVTVPVDTDPVLQVPQLFLARKYLVPDAVITHEFVELVTSVPVEDVCQYHSSPPGPVFPFLTIDVEPQL
jgi:hypothetical protein